jgi:hypothetical protein
MKKPRTLDRGDIAPGGEADGEGGRPPPLSPSRKLMPITPTPPGLLLRSPWGGGSAWRYPLEIRAGGLNFMARVHTERGFILRPTATATVRPS